MKFSDEWSKIERKLKETIQKSARSLYEKKLFSLEQMNQFFISSNLEGVFFFFKSFLKTSFKWSECSLCIHLCFLNVTLEENKQQHKWYK